MSYGRYISDAHRRVTKMVGYALRLRDEHAMLSLAVVLRARLDAGDRAFLAIAALKSLDEDDLSAVLGYVCDEGGEDE